MSGVDLEAEREVDLRSWWGRIVDRWWLPVIGALVGAILGVLVSLGGGDVYEASTLLYLGQPFAPGGGGQIQSLQTNPRTVNEIVRSETAVRRAAAAAGLRPAQLRGGISVTTITSPGQGKTTSPLQEITVQAPARAKAQKAADELASSVLASVAPYVDNKVKLLERQIRDNERDIATTNERIAAALQNQATATANENLSLGERILIQTNVNNTLQFYEARLTNRRQDLTSAEQALNLAKLVEQSRVVQQAAAVRTSATAPRNAVVVGGLIGLLLGALAAIMADPILRRRAVASAQ